MRLAGDQICSRCVLDGSVPNLDLDGDGVCRFCRDYEPILASLRISKDEEARRLDEISRRIRRHGANRQYDSILGLSGGVDSSYVAVLARRMGLRPLVVHFDNGWNSELAVENIRLLVDALEFDLHTYVIHWPEFKDLQRSFFRASVVDIEMLTDHAITASMVRLARQFRIRHVLSGVNFATESGMPREWLWFKQDLRNIRAIQRRFGTMKIRSFPTCGNWRWRFIMATGRLRFVEPLNSIHYLKGRARQCLESEFGWRYYGGKHYESVFTKFYQAYVLPQKFGIDKRRSHLSSLIRNGELDRAEAMAELEQPPYDPEQLRIDRQYVLKKLDFSDQEFDEIMRSPVRCHADYPSDADYEWLLRPFRGLYQRIKRPPVAYGG
jgi:N-acetyl sugar amidotransferase